MSDSIFHSFGHLGRRLMALPHLKSIFISGAAAALLAGQPDEGQWLPQQVLAMDWDELQRRGLKLTKDQFWHPTDGGVLSAAVQIGGCSASFCSPDGLVVTNHHCGFGAVNALSTPENNYLRDGFVAAKLEDELPANGMVVQVVRRIEDVTAKIHAAQERATNDLERFQLTQATIRELIREGEKEPNTTCSISPFYEGREYHLYYRTRLTDVRLCYAPPRSVGEFGGEVDNWEWPRHTGDFAFFRAYAAPDGSPRPYSTENVPFRPEHWLPVSKSGAREGDLAMILGYPGRTERYLTSTAVMDRQGFFYPKRLDLFSRVIEVLEAASRRDEATALRYASTIKSLANVKKNAEGMVWGLERNAVVERKLREEAEFAAWIAATPERLEAYGSAFDDVEAIALEARKTQEKDLLLSVLVSARINPFFRRIVELSANSGQVKDGEVSEGLRNRFADDSISVDFESVQVPILIQLLDEARQMEGLEGRDALSPLEDVPTETVVRQILAETALTTPEGRLELLKGGRDAVEASSDPLMVLARGLDREMAQRALRGQRAAGKRLVSGRRWIDAQQEWRGKSFYPDANSTLRVSIASVQGYQPRDGVTYTPFTTVDGVLRKNTGESPFNSPQALLDAAPDRLQSRFFDERLGDVPTCFLTDGDTTGGNSGSPVINGRGELIGLNFDRVFENVSGDFGWNAKRSRNISVDIRYVLWFLEQVMPAPRLLEEMGAL